MQIHRYERIWLILGTGALVLFLIIIGFQTFAMGMAPPSHIETVDPQALDTEPPFNEPGLKKVGENEYEAVMIGYMFGYNPNELEVPVGATVHFIATTPDVVHGFQIVGTNVNAMLEPGYVSKVSHTFNEPGEYLLLCNEYCGVGHQDMMGKVIVKE